MAFLPYDGTRIILAEQTVVLTPVERPRPRSAASGQAPGADPPLPRKSLSITGRHHIPFPVSTDESSSAGRRRATIRSGASGLPVFPDVLSRGPRTAYRRFQQGV